MARGISLRNGCKGDDLRFLARSSRDAKQARRLLALSLIYDGASRSEAVRHANASPQTVRDWVLRFNAEGPDGLVDWKSPGTPLGLNTRGQPLCVWSRKVRRPVSMAWCGGVCAIWCLGFATSSASHWINRRSVGHYGTWVIGS